MLNMEVYSTDTPKQVQYNKLPDGTAEVWMRKDIIEEVTEEGGTQYKYKEVMFITSEPEESIVANFDTWFNFGSTWTGEPLNNDIIIKRLQSDYNDLSNAVIELADMITELGG